MRLLVTIGIFSTLLAYQSFGQITINSSDYPKAGDHATTINLDSTSAADLVIGAAGANKSWDFSQIGIEAGSEYTSYYGNATGSAFAADFPEANLAQGENPDFSDPTNDVNYLKKTNTEAHLLGTGSVDGLTVYLDPLKVAAFPFTYNSNFDDDGIFEFDVDDMTKDTALVAVEVTGDAWGTIKTPVGTYQTLRVKDVQESEYNFSGFEFKITTTIYSFLTK
ncbi:MAG: hypothetical protein ABIV51_03285, partial [Saprospiraceae bacterium]